ncbi:MAG: bifunctional riboflavin kinase/FAD synthetase [Lentisphaerae bacterium]|jgi:riboflavin kinase/FMN adenylyltransferase|nr:bifunctional riboflavin kinase/FAD synthetase [Lentisphaerota bacterium]
MIVNFPSELPTGNWVVSLGVFDGVHIGHQEIFRQLTRLAQEHDAQPAALFFSPHPKAIVSPGSEPKAICTPQHNIQLLNQAKIHNLIQFPFTEELAKLNPSQFIETYFWKAKATFKAFCVGQNWRFGYKNSGTPQTLQEICSPHGIQTTIVPSVLLDGQPVSSTRVRNAIAEGNMTLAARLLGRPFDILGTVAHGHRVGSTLLDYPTANLNVNNRILPPFGVYAARGKLNGDRSLDGIAYVGDAPTIRDDKKPEIIVELHLFDFNEDIYGQELAIQFIEHIRPSRKFNSPQELQAQIQADIKKARQLLTTT